MMLLRYDENEVMVNFKPGDQSEYDVFFLSVTQAYSDKVKKIRVLPTGVEPMTFRLVLRMLYH